jgi:aminopeptidase Y
MCEFHVKAENAAAAGAAAVIIFNRSDQTGLVGGTLLSGYSGGIPVVGATFDRGLEWAMTPGLVMRVSTTGEKRSFQVHSVIAENNLGDANNVVMLGGHLDSVVGGPGINDNGSGAAALLETALQMSGVKTRNRVRFAFWAAHEFGNLGSNTYLSNLTQAQLDAIVLYIDVVSIGSPNYVHFVLDGDGSDGEAGPAGSGSVEQYLKAFYTSRGLPTVPLRLPFFSNVLSFVDAGIASGAIYGGSVGIKTPEETLLFGGTAGDPYDPCYHLPCDTYANPSMAALDVNSDAVAYAVLGLGMNTEFVNGVKGQGRFKARKVVAQSSSTSLVTR